MGSLAVHVFAVDRRNVQMEVRIKDGDYIPDGLGGVVR